MSADAAWPQRLLPVANLGCGMYVCLDCSVEPEEAVLFEPNIEGENCFVRLAVSLEDWLQAWLTDVDVVEPAWNRKFGLDK